MDTVQESSLLEASECVLCQQTIQQGRLLPCLHNVCLPCVQEKVSGKNTILCLRCGTLAKPPQSGYSQLQALPNCYNTQADGSEGEKDRMCDECAEDEIAEGVCLRCGLHLCADHVTSHSKGRTTRGHKVQTLSEVYSAGTDVVENRSSCPLHAAQQLELYCEQCNELLCKRCESLGSHGDHQDSVIAVKNAVRKLRQELIEIRRASRNPTEAKTEQSDGDKTLPNVHQSGPPQAKHLKSSLQFTESSISKLTKRIETVSAEVETAFGQVLDTAKQRQQKLLDELDPIYWKALQELEEQQRHLKMSIAACEQIDFLLDRCQNDLDFLRMARWLKDQMLSIDDCLEKGLDPVSYIVLQQQNLAEFVVLTGKVGKISDEAIDATQSRLSCPSTAVVDSEVTIEVEAKNSTGGPVPMELVKEMGFSLCITPMTSGDGVECELGPGSSAGMLMAKFKPPAGGKYLVSATMARRHLQGSPVVFDSGTGSCFDPNCVGPNTRLSNNNRTAAVAAASAQGAGVCCLPAVSSGLIEFRVRLDTYNGSYGCHMAVTSRNPPVLDIVHFSDGYGWDLQSEGRGYGGLLSPSKFQEGDIVSVFLDCDRSLVTFTHERTGLSQTCRKLPVGQYHLCILMCGHSGRRGRFDGGQAAYAGQYVHAVPGAGLAGHADLAGQGGLPTVSLVSP